ncbi:ImmA/IrrE family metallo-endopeptidase [Peribacillus sp. SCS-37]|uniref:ImmA/IrrE family metallo-endopeptidase n=1 Tax=Paraperibacillus esterisolvens TaxID=3115296 RepID=UPI003906AE41
MGIERIMFNPYQDKNIQDVIGIIEEYLNETHPKTALSEISNKIFFDDSVGWREILKIIFKNNEHLTVRIPLYFIEFVQTQSNEILPQYSYLITFLVAENLLDVDFLTKEIFQSIGNENAKYLLMSFLASWNLDKAMELDASYIDNNFKHKIESERIPIRQLILSAADASYFNVVSNMLMDVTIQYYFNNEIKRIINAGNVDDLKQLELFLDRCNKDSQEHIIEFFSDLTELGTVQTFLLKQWNFKLTERLYKNFSTNNHLMSDYSREISLIAVNRLKRKQNTNYSVAARYEINKLKEMDKNYILQRVKKIADTEIVDYDNVIVPPVNDAWEWKDYAHYLVTAYKEKHPEEETIHVQKLANELGIETIVKRLGTENFDACLVRDCTLKAPVIIVNSTKKSMGRVNFSIAHEIAHAVLPHHANRSFFCFLDDVTESNKFKMDKHLEIEANKFAAYILLPDKQFKEEVNKLNFTMKNVYMLSKKYSASMVLVAKKWAEVSNLEIAMVLSTDGLVDWWIKSDSFPYSWIEPVIDKQSSVFLSFNSKGKSKRKKVMFDQWFKSDFPRYRLHEESYAIFDNKALTLLQIVDVE